jgi:hypothetical protein
MAHIAGFGRDQLLLLPEAVDDYVDGDNPVRFIDAFVYGLDLAGAGFARVEAKATGRPGYALRPTAIETASGLCGSGSWLSCFASGNARDHDGACEARWTEPPSPSYS